MTGERWRPSVTRSRAGRWRFDMVLLVVAVMLVLFTMGKTVQVAQSAALRTDLTYRRTVEEFESTLQGLGPDSIAQLVSARIARSATDTVSVDTIAVVADTIAEPALATGGFLRDQIARYNDEAIRQAVNGVTRRELQADPDNLLRVIRTGAGRLRLADRVNATGMIVRSPSAERDWRSVRTADAGSKIAAIGLAGSMPILPGATTTQGLLNGRPCELRGGTTRGLLYCGAALGAEVARFYDLAIERPTDPAPMRLDTYRGRTMWLDGRSTTARGMIVTHGAVGELRATGPFLLSGVAAGHLAEEQWVNGSRQLEEQPAGTIGFFGRAGRAARWPANGEALQLSLDGAMSSDLEQVALRFHREHARELEAMSVVVVDAVGGHVRAVVEPTRSAPGAPLLAFEPRLVGSVVKPIVAAAILSRQPALARLVVDYAGPLATRIDGVPLTRPFANAANGCGSRIDFAGFLRCSSNQYAAELLLRSFRRDGYTASRDGAAVPHAVLERSDVADGLAFAFDVDAYAGRTAGRTVPFWDVDTRGSDGIVSAVSDASLIPYESRPWLLSARGTATPVDWLARYAFGGWENRWTLLSVAQSYARIATDREVTLSFLRDGPPRGAPLFGDSVATAMRQVREALFEVGASGTAVPLNAVIRGVLGAQTAVLAKTGTLNEASPDDIAVKALAMVIGEKGTSASGTALRCGLAIVIYFDFDRDEIRRLGAASLPPVHVEFATRYLPAVLERHWSRIAGCATPTVVKVR